MDHSKIYNLLMKKAVDRDWISPRWKVGTVEPDCVVECHHILPKCLGGTDSKDNLAVLSLKEHFIAHLLLTKIYPEEDSILRAFVIMCNRTDGKTASDYESQMGAYRKAQSEYFKGIWTDEMREEARQRGLKLIKDPEYLAKISQGVRRAYETTDLRSRISDISKDNWKDPEYRDRVSKSLKEYWKDENKIKEHSERIKQQNKDNPKLAEKRLDGIKDHMYNKPEEWKERAGKWMNDWYKLPGNETVLSDRYFEKGNKFNNSRIVVNNESGEEYRSIKQAAIKTGINYNTLKKWLYENNKKCPVHFKEKKDDNE